MDLEELLGLSRDEGLRDTKGSSGLYGLRSGQGVQTHLEKLMDWKLRGLSVSQKAVCNLQLGLDTQNGYFRWRFPQRAKLDYKTWDLAKGSSLHNWP